MNATEPDLKYIHQMGRGPRVDWFAEQTPSTTIASTMAAMANYQGGVIVLGIATPTGSALGVRDAESSSNRILQAALELDPPLIIPMPQTVQYSGLSFVMAHIPQGMPSVYSIDGRYLTRQDAENIPLRPAELHRLIMQRGITSFESEITFGATLEDMNWPKVEAYLTSVRGIGESDVHKALLKRGCLAIRDDKFYPTNAGILLFGKDPQRFIRGAEITAARFGGETMSDSFSKQDILGTLPDQIRRAETFLVDHLRKGVKLGSTMARLESFEYPLEAARELVVNAVAHRDYSISGDGIRLFIFRDRMEITNPGKLAGPVTVDNIKDERFSRNPVIVQVLADMGFIERLGYGVDRVLQLMQQQQLSQPSFTETAGGFQVVLHNKPQAATPQPEVPPTEFNGNYKGVEINPRQEAALIYLHTPGNNRITNSILQQLCPDVHAETIRRDLVDLVSKSILQKMGQKRGSYYILQNS